MEIIDKIEILLKEQHKTKAELCEFLGLKNPTFSHWKSGANSSYKKYLPQIAEFFNVSVDFLIGKTDVLEKNKTHDKNIADLKYQFNNETSVMMLSQEPELPFKMPTDNITLTAKEIELIKAYRNKPEMQESVNILLGLKTQSNLSDDMAKTINETAQSPINKK